MIPALTNVAVGLLNGGGSIAVGTSSHVDTLGASLDMRIPLKAHDGRRRPMASGLGQQFERQREMGLAVVTLLRLMVIGPLRLATPNETTTLSKAYAIALGTNAKLRILQHSHWEPAVRI